jgi:hypothetical protein
MSLVSCYPWTSTCGRAPTMADQAGHRASAGRPAGRWPDGLWPAGYHPPQVGPQGCSQRMIPAPSDSGSGQVNRQQYQRVIHFATHTSWHLSERGVNGLLCFAKSNRSLLEFGWLNVKYCQLVSTNFYFCKEIIFKRYTEMHICKLDCLVELYTYTVSLEIVTCKIRADEKKPLVFFWKL